MMQYLRLMLLQCFYLPVQNVNFFLPVFFLSVILLILALFFQFCHSVFVMFYQYLILCHLLPKIGKFCLFVLIYKHKYDKCHNTDNKCHNTYQNYHVLMIVVLFLQLYAIVIFMLNVEDIVFCAYFIQGILKLRNFIHVLLKPFRLSSFLMHGSPSLHHFNLKVSFFHVIRFLEHDLCLVRLTAIQIYFRQAKIRGNNRAYVQRLKENLLCLLRFLENIRIGLISPK